MKRFYVSLLLLFTGFISCMPISRNVSAGSFSSDFNAGLPDGASVFGDAAVEATGGASDSGVLALTPIESDKQGSFVVNELDPGESVGSFTAAFKLRIGGGTGANGFSFNFAPDIPEGPFAEEGAGLGLTIAFDSFDNGGGEAPAIDIKFRGATIASKRVNVRSGDAFVDVSVKADLDGTVDVVFDNTIVHENLFAYIPSPGRFGLGARTSELNDAHWVDDLSITTRILDKPFVRSASPSGFGARPNSAVLIELQDFGTIVNSDSIQLMFDGNSVEPTVTKAGAVTRIEYQPEGFLPSGSIHTVRLDYLDSGVSPSTSTVEFGFTVEDYTTVPAGFAVPASALDLESEGFSIRTVQARADSGLAPTLARAEAQLAGTLIDPVSGIPFGNEAKPSANADGTFDEKAVINFEKDGNPSGNFVENEKNVPGLPGRTGHSVNAAAEISTFLNLSAGYHRFGVNSDDGFKVTIGGPNPRDAFSPILGQFDGERTARDTLFAFVAESSGIYAFRIVWFQSGGGGSIEFFSVLDDGTKILINDPQVDESIKAIRSLQDGGAAAPFVKSVTPKPGETGVGLRPSVRVELEDAQSQVVTSSMQLELNGSSVPSTVSRSGTSVIVTFRPASNLENLSVNTLELAFQDGANPANVFTREWEFTTARVVKATGQWDFDGGDLGATYGFDLAYGDEAEVSSLTEFGTTVEFGIPDVNGVPASVMKYNRTDTPGEFQPGYLLRHCISPNGGGANVNQWTLLMDVLFPDPQISPFFSLIQMDATSSDGELFVRWNDVAGPKTGGIGVFGQYTGDGQTSVSIGQWHRLAFAVDTGSSSPVLSKYIDGVKFEDQGLTPPQLDGKYSLNEDLRLFADESNDLNTFYVNSVQILNGKLTDDEIAELGAPAADGIPPNPADTIASSEPPVMRIQLVSNSVIISWPESCQGFALESSDDVGASEWAPVPGVVGTTATLDLASSSKFYRLRQ